MNEADRARTAAQDKPTGVVIVHGMGHPDPGDLLGAIVRSLLAFMTSLAAAQLEIEAPVKHTSSDADGRVLISVSFCGRQWVFTEAHWAPHITSPPFLDTMRWAIWHFLSHAALLFRDAILRSLLPAVMALTWVALHAAWALLLLPARVLMLAIAPLLAARVVTHLERLYRRAIDTLPDDEADIEALLGRLQLWKRLAPRVVAPWVAIPMMLPLVLLGLWADWVAAPRLWVVPALVFVLATLLVLSYQFADRLTTDPALNGMPLPITVSAGILPSKHGFLQARVGRPGAALVFSDGVRQIVAGPAEAALAGARHWLIANCEHQLLDYIEWAGKRPLPLIKVGALVTMLAAFRILASFVWATLYLLGALLIIPVTALIVAFSAFSRFPVIASLVSRIKQTLEGLVLTSIGDINMFIRHPKQAAVARAEVERALDALNARCDKVCIVAHSLGCAVSYDTLVQPHNAERAAPVRTLMTIGGILPMVWRTAPRRATFDAALPGDIRWVNLWARFDPAEGGPIDRARASIAMPGLQELGPPSRKTFLWLLPHGAPRATTFEDVAVSNEDDILFDHTTYWQNEHEVIPRIAFEIWPDGAERLDRRVRSDAIRTFRRRVRVLKRTGPRVLAWCAGPLLLAAGVGLWPAALTTAGLAIVASVNGRRRARPEPWPESTTDLQPNLNGGTTSDGKPVQPLAIALSTKKFRGLW